MIVVHTSGFSCSSYINPTNSSHNLEPLPTCASDVVPTRRHPQPRSPAKVTCCVFYVTTSARSHVWFLPLQISSRATTVTFLMWSRPKHVKRVGSTSARRVPARWEGARVSSTMWSTTTTCESFLSPPPPRCGCPPYSHTFQFVPQSGLSL
jgi:hypothetical protein